MLLKNCSHKGLIMMKHISNHTIMLFAASTSLLMGGGDLAPVPVPAVPIPVVEKTPFYIGVAASDMRLLNQDTDEEFSATGITLQAGYIYSEYLSIELRYSQNAGSVSYENGITTTVADTDDYSTDFVNMGIYLKPAYSIDSLTLYALLGYGEVSLTNIPEGDTDRGEDGFQWGVGLSYAIDESWSLFADYMSLYSGEGFDHLAINNDNEATLVSVGISYRF